MTLGEMTNGGTTHTLENDSGARSSTSRNSPNFDEIEQRLISRVFSDSWISSASKSTTSVLLLLGIALYALLGFVVFSQYETSSDSIEALEMAMSQVAVEGRLVDSVEDESDELVKVVTERNIFGLKERKKSTDKAKPKTTPAPKKSTIPLELVGTFVSKDMSEAIIANKKTKTQDGFRVGESVFEVATLRKVSPNQVEIERNGAIELLILEEGGSGGGEAESDFDEEIQIESGELEDALDNLPLLLTQARAVPYFKDGKPVGLRLFAIRNGSLYEKAGLKNGDILRDVNGNSLADISKAAKLFEMLRDERQITLRLERNREEKKFRYSIN